MCVILDQCQCCLFVFQDSPLYDVLCHAQPSLSNHAPDHHPNDIISYNLGASQFLTPTRRGRMQDRPLVENGQPPRSRSLAVFLNKVCRLAYHRLQLLCNTLTIPRDVVSTRFRHVIRPRYIHNIGTLLRLQIVSICVPSSSCPHNFISRNFDRSCSYESS